MNKSINYKWMLHAQLFLMMLWGAQLLLSDAYYVNYALLVTVSGICSYINMTSKDDLSGKSSAGDELVIEVFAIAFSCMVAFANYKIWGSPDIPEEYDLGFKWWYKIFLTMVFFVGGYLSFWNIFKAISAEKKRLFWKEGDREWKPEYVFLVSFLLIVLTRWIVLYYSLYPGVLTTDSISQISQIMSGSYTNHHPFYHTMVIKCFVTLGLDFFNDINAAVATYSMFQIVFTAICFSFAASTMALMKAPRWMIVTAVMFFVFMPYHIMYSFTMWKDVMFACFVLLFVTFVYRCLNNIGNRFLNYVILTASSIGTCLFRSNGFFAFVILTIGFMFLWKLKNNRVLLLLISVIIVSFVMKHAVLAKLGVAQPDTVESLSIPVQQIARVVQEGHKLDDWQMETLSKVIDVEQIPGNYSSYISDPIKKLVRKKGNQQLIIDEKAEYIRLYVSLGMKYPKVYIRAWIDQTKGYWNAGYEYWRWSLGVKDNELGIKRITKNSFIDKILKQYLWLFTNVQGFKVFISIGLFVWADMLMLMIALLRKDKTGVFVTLPVLVIVASLLVATPVFSEFRYIYAAFCTLPMVIVIALRPVD